MPNRLCAQANIEAALRVEAALIVHNQIKNRARAFLKCPMALDALLPGLTERAAPDAILTLAKQMMVKERDTPRRWFGFGGEAPMLNAKALLLYGRILRRTAGHDCKVSSVADALRSSYSTVALARRS
jgi:hypothetical protein